MTTKRASLSAFAPRVEATPAQVTPPTAQPVPARKTPVAKTREGKRSAMVYLDPAAFKQLQILSAQEDATVQDLLVEAVNELFAKRGLSRIA